MSLSHHGDIEHAAKERLLNQFLGQARRAYPAGRTGADDDGELAYAIAADPRHQVIRIEFGKAVKWIALRPGDAQRLLDALQEKLFELRGITK